MRSGQRFRRKHLAEENCAAPSGCCSISINQFIDSALPAPRGPPCWLYPRRPRHVPSGPSRGKAIIQECSRRQRRLPARPRRNVRRGQPVCSGGGHVHAGHGRCRRPARRLVPEPVPQESLRKQKQSRIRALQAPQNFAGASAEGDTPRDSRQDAGATSCDRVIERKSDSE